jgi:circadian clock protein KaiC
LRVVLKGLGCKYPSMTTENRLSSGVTGLDDVLGGGFPAGHLYLIEGDPGTGKTTLALSFLMTAARLSEKSLYITLSESKQELLGVAKSHGWSLDNIEIFELLPEEQYLGPEGQYTVFHPSEVELADTTKTILGRVQELSPKRIVVDSMSELRMLARDPLRYRRQILALKQYFTARQCTVLLLDDRTGTQADLQLQSIAHGVIVLENLPREYGAKRRRMEVVKLRASQFREGFHDYNIVTGGLKVYPRLVAAEFRSAEITGTVSSGLPELDTLWGGGIDRGTSTLIMGPAGSGKSTVAAQYLSAAAARGESCSVYLFEEGIATYVKRGKGLGLDLTAHVENKRVLIEQVDPAELSPGEFAACVRRSVDEDNAKLVVIDSLNGYLNAMPGEKFLEMHLHELLAYLNQKGVATFLIMAQHGLLGRDMISPVDVSYLADSVLLLRFFEAQGEIRQAISVVKKRSGGHERSIRELRFDHAIKVGPPLRNFKGVLSGVPDPTTKDEPKA